MSKFGALGHRLYTGEVSYDFMGRSRRWYTISAVMIAIALIALLARGLDFGIEFRGGADFKATTQVNAQTVDSMKTALQDSGVPELQDSIINTIGGDQVRVQTRTLDATEEVPKVRSAIADEAGVNSEEVAYSLIGASWGKQITNRALIALVVFLTLVGLVIWVYFRNGKMSIAALVALAHDLILTIGIYALIGFTVTPATVIGVLTILGYSLYDTVVVFDKVRENVRDIKSNTTRTYSEAANLAVNQVLVRSINTTVIGVLPVTALLVAGAVILGEGPLKDLALALFIGMISGAYSSIFIATPLLAQLKEREPEMKKLAARVATRRTKEAQKSGSTSAGSTALSSRASSVAVKERTEESETEPDGVIPNEPGTREIALSFYEDGRSTPRPVSDGSPKPRPVTDGAAKARPVADGAAKARPVADGAAKARPVADGAAKRPQPQHKPRSQRKK